MPPGLLDATIDIPEDLAPSTSDDTDWIGRSQISPPERQSGGGSLPASGGPPLVPVLLVGGPILVFLLLVAGGLVVVLARQRS